MRIAFFDLDGTLLDGATEGLWVALLAERGHLDPAEFARFRADYLAGRLDVAAYNAWQNAPCAVLGRGELDALREELVRERVLPRIGAAARALVASERARHDLVVLATAASDFLVEKVAEALGVDELLATPLIRSGGRPTGALAGEPCYQAGKLRAALALLTRRGLAEDALAHASFFSDSMNDLPLLERVGRPVAVDPDAALEARARIAGWEIVRLYRPADGDAAAG